MCVDCFICEANRLNCACLMSKGFFFVTFKTQWFYFKLQFAHYVTWSINMDTVFLGRKWKNVRSCNKTTNTTTWRYPVSVVVFSFLGSFPCVLLFFKSIFVSCSNYANAQLNFNYIHVVCHKILLTMYGWNWVFVVCACGLFHFDNQFTTIYSMAI